MKELDYQIVRSPKRKTLTITVERDRAVVVHVPEGTPEQEVHRVVDKKRQWRRAGNIRHSAAIGSTLYALTAPLRSIKGLFRRS